MQGPWSKTEELQGSVVRGSGSPSGRSPTGSLQQSQATPARGLLGLRNGFMHRRAARSAARKLSEGSECGVALGIPKVALLFLTPGDMPLEQVRRVICPLSAICHYSYCHALQL